MKSMHHDRQLIKPFVRPAANGCKIGKDGVAEEGFVYTTEGPG